MIDQRVKDFKLGINREGKRNIMARIPHKEKKQFAERLKQI